MNETHTLQKKKKNVKKRLPTSPTNCVYYLQIRHKHYFRRNNINNIGIKNCALRKGEKSHAMKW